MELLAAGTVTRSPRQNPGSRGWACPAWEKGAEGTFLEVHANNRQCGSTTKLAPHLYEPRAWGFPPEGKVNAGRSHVTWGDTCTGCFTPAESCDSDRRERAMHFCNKNFFRRSLTIAPCSAWFGKSYFNAAFGGRGGVCVCQTADRRTHKEKPGSASRDVWSSDCRRFLRES